jgi:hypothetical protein
MIVLTRQWNAEHSGVYVFASDKTPSNPYLEVPQRDIPVKDGKPSAVQALSLREASDRRGVTTHVPKEIVNSTKKESANSAALQVAARAAREQASTLVKLGELLLPRHRLASACQPFKTFNFCRS